jgi:flavin reductase (DIM6/NTAB) family NADH-FMN oxidoreductase RutF
MHAVEQPTRGERADIAGSRNSTQSPWIELPDDELTPSVLREAFGLFPTGVIAICAEVDGNPEGLAASSFVPVSFDPPLVSVCFAHTSNTWPRLRTARRLGISVLSEEHAELARQFSSSTENRFADVPWVATAEDSILVEGSALWLECEIEQEIRAGDHDIVILRVHFVQQHPDVAPVVYHSRNLGGFDHHSSSRKTVAQFRDELPPHNSLNDSLFAPTAEHAWG